MEERWGKTAADNLIEAKENDEDRAANEIRFHPDCPGNEAICTCNAHTRVYLFSPYYTKPPPPPNNKISPFTYGYYILGDLTLGGWGGLVLGERLVQ